MTGLPVWREEINQVSGMLHLRKLMQETLTGKPLTREAMLSRLEEPYFVPENTPLNIQLLNFQREHRRAALVVDEYGDILGVAHACGYSGRNCRRIYNGYVRQLTADSAPTGWQLPSRWCDDGA